MTFDLMEEDELIWARLIERGSIDLVRLNSIYCRGDVRDAQLMRAFCYTWDYVRARGCSRREWWAAFRSDVEKTAQQGVRL